MKLATPKTELPSSIQLRKTVSGALAICAVTVLSSLIVTPAEAAQPVTDRCVALGVKAILNFAPVNLRVPEDVYLRNENMSMELEFLSFALVNNHPQKRTK